jgi:hypothetical protein
MSEEIRPISEHLGTGDSSRASYLNTDMRLLAELAARVPECEPVSAQNFSVIGARSMAAVASEMRRAPGEWRTIISSAAARSAVPVAFVNVAATMSPLRFSISAWPMKLSLASLPPPCDRVVPRDLCSRHVWRCWASRRGSRARHCGQVPAARSSRPCADPRVLLMLRVRNMPPRPLDPRPLGS